MSEEEIVKRNTEKLFEYYTNEELFVDGMQSQEGAARSAAKQLFKVSENLIVSVSSELYESGAVDLTVTDTKDKVMILHLSRWGSLDEITDEEGAVLFMKIM